MPKKIVPNVVDGEVIVKEEKTITDDTLLKDAPDKLKKLKDIALAHGYKIALANVNGGLAHKINPEKHDIAHLTVKEAGLLYHYITCQEKLTGKDLETRKLLAQTVIQECLKTGKPWGDGWNSVVSASSPAQVVGETPNPVSAV